MNPDLYPTTKHCTFGVVTLGPVVSSTGLSEDEIVGSENSSERAGPDRVHRPGFKIEKDSPRDILATWEKNKNILAWVEFAEIDQVKCEFS